MPCLPTDQNFTLRPSQKNFFLLLYMVVAKKSNIPQKACPHFNYIVQKFHPEKAVQSFAQMEVQKIRIFFPTHLP